MSKELISPKGFYMPAPKPEGKNGGNGSAKRRGTEGPWPGSARRVDVSVIVYVDEHLEGAAEMYSYMANLLQTLGKTFEYIFVDDGNHKKIFVELEGFSKFVRDAKVIRLPRSYGPTAAMSVGFRHARGGIILTLGPFMQVQPHEIRKMFLKMDEGYDFVNGWRVNRTDSWFNSFQSRAYNRLIRIISQVNVHDTNCTLKLFRREIVEDLPFYGDIYRFLPILAARQGVRVCEVPVDQRREINPFGVYPLWTYVRRVLDLLILLFIERFIMTPLRFFGILGSFMILLGLSVNSYLILAGLLGQHHLSDRSLIPLGVLLMVLGVQAVSVGLIGELIIFANARHMKDYRIEKVLE